MWIISKKSSFYCGLRKKTYHCQSGHINIVVSVDLIPNKNIIWMLIEDLSGEHFLF